MSDLSQNLPGSSTPNSRKRSKWDVTAEEDESELARLRSIIKKRPKIKNIRVHEPEPQRPTPETTTVPTTKGQISHSKFVPPRTFHPPYFQMMLGPRFSLLLQAVCLYASTAAVAFQTQGSGPNWEWSLCGQCLHQCIYAHTTLIDTPASS